MTTLHDVKIEPRWFDRIQQNEKFAEVRYDDRDYQTGDRIRFWRNDTTPEYKYSVERTITHVTFSAAWTGSTKATSCCRCPTPRVANLQARLDYQIEACQRLERSNRGLRGANTRLRAGR